MPLTIKFSGDQILTANLKEITDGTGMFKQCKGFDGGCDDPVCLENLENGTSMFEEMSCSCETLYLYVPKITNATKMFKNSGIKNITLHTQTTFGSGPLNAEEMFYGSHIESTCGVDFSVVENGASMFQNCENLSYVGCQFTSLKNGNYMFSSCGSLTSINGNLPELTCATYMLSGTAIKANDESGCVFEFTVPKLVEANGLFENCEQLQQVSLNTPLLEYICGIFDGCTNISSITFDCDLNKVNSSTYIFSGNTSLGYFYSKNWNSLTDAEGMFKECTCLYDVSFGDVNTVYNTSKMFYGCTNLTTVSLGLFMGIENMKQMFYNCKNLQSLTANTTSGIHSIFGLGPIDAKEAFKNCTSLTDISFGKRGVQYGQSMFENCRKITSADAIDKLEYGCSMFKNCTSLETATINSSYFVDGPSMFYNCSKLRECTISSIKLQNTGAMFYGCSSLQSFSFGGNSQENTALTETSCMFTSCYALKYVNAMSVANAEAVCGIIISLPTYEPYYTETSCTHVIEINPTTQKDELIIMAIEKGWHVATTPDPYYSYEYIC